MNDEKKRPGLGKVIYSVNDPIDSQSNAAENVDKVEVEEASEESFPASDAPGYSGGSISETTDEA